jgi:ankyrin repeat protein
MNEFSVLLAHSGRKHVFQDLEPYMCTYEDCPIAHKTYATRRAFITHEIRHHREVARKFGCNFCGKGFDRKRDAKKHIHFDKCRWSTKLDSLSNPKGRYSKRGFHITEERVANSVCPFCAKEITGGCGNLTQHLGKHLEEVSFAVVRKPYEEWQFYEDSVSAKSPVPSVVLNEDICKSTVRGDVKMVMNLLIEGADVNTEIDGKSLLHVASAKGHYAMVWLLLQKGADHQKKSRPMVVNNPSFSSMHRLGMLDSGEKAQTALEVASINGHIEVAALLAKVASDQGFQTTSENALLLAAEFGQLSIVEELVRCFETVGDDCLPASLHFAAKNGYIDIVRFLLPHATKTVQSTCLNPALSKWYNYTDTLHAALKGGHKAIALLLLEHGHRISESTWYECGLSGDRNLFSAMLTHEPKSCMLSDSALVGAIERGHTEFVKMLLDNGNKATSDAITRASRLGHSTILSLLLDQGAVPEASDLRQAIGNGHTDTIELLVLRHPELLPAVQFQSISLALSSGSAKTVEKVLQLVQELPYPNHFELENGALYDAAAKGHGEIVRLLILKGFDVNAEGDFRENPLHRACEGGHHEVVELLLGAGAAVNGTNGSKLRTPLAYARTQAVYDMLVERGGVKYIYKDSSWVIEDEFNNEYY